MQYNHYKLNKLMYIKNIMKLECNHKEIPPSTTIKSLLIQIQGWLGWMKNVVDEYFILSNVSSVKWLIPIEQSDDLVVKLLHI